MSHQDPNAKEDGLENLDVDSLLELLKSSGSWKPKTHWAPYLLIVLYGIVAALLSLNIAILYFVILTVIFTLQSVDEQRRARQIDIVVRLSQKLNEKSGG